MLTRKRNREIDIEKAAPLSLLFTAQWRGIFETHIVPKLRPKSELKFLSMAFKDARDAVRRAGIEVEEEFKISEFTSISQMELAWDNYSWGEHGYFGTQQEWWFCQRVVKMNKLEYLVWLREVKNCDWGSDTIAWVAGQGYPAVAKYCVDNGCDMDAAACNCAAS